jgi:hypothetical protein
MTSELQSFVHNSIKKYMETRLKLTGNLILEYLLIHPELSIDDIELVEQRMSNMDIIWYVRKRGSND